MKKLILILFLLPLFAHAQWQAGKYESICTIECLDPEGDEVYFTITAGNSAGYFQIQPCSGIIQVDTIAYTTFLRQRTFTLTFACTDTQKNTSKQQRKITLKKDASGNRLTPFISNPIVAIPEPVKTYQL